MEDKMFNESDELEVDKLIKNIDDVRLEFQSIELRYNLVKIVDKYSHNNINDLIKYTKRLERFITSGDIGSEFYSSHF